MKLYVASDNDKYELPVAVAETVKELAMMLGKSRSSMQQCIQRQSNTGKYKYSVVIVEDEE